MGLLDFESIPPGYFKSNYCLHGKDWIRLINPEDLQAFIDYGLRMADRGKMGGVARANTALRDSRGRFISNKTKGANTMTKHLAYFERFTIELTEEQALAGSHPGPCDDDIKALLMELEIKAQIDNIPAEKIRDELQEYGAWDEIELADDEKNRMRILWLACGNIRDDIAAMED